MKKQLLILMTLFISIIGYSQTFVQNSITYNVTSTSPNTVEITDYDTNGGPTVTIPETVMDNSITYSVTAIGTAAFENNQLTSVIIPNGVINIGNAAFAQNQLTSIAIPDSVLNIGLNAFLINFNLTNLDLGNSVETIGVNAFADNNISSVVIPNSVLTIGGAAFTYNNNMTNLVIGNSVTTIGDNAFATNPAITSLLTNVSIPSSVTTIGNNAFSIPSLIDVTSLATTPASITTGTNDTFGDRSNINLTIPNGTENTYIAAQWINFASVTLNISDFELVNEIILVTKANTLEIISSGTAKLKNYTIYSITGAKVKEGAESNIAIETLSNGIYILDLTFDKGKLVKKFAK